MRKVPVAFCIAILCACADEPANELPLYQEKLAERPDQLETSSHAECYCFPKGPECYYGMFASGPKEAPSNVPACAEGEGCFASSSWYSAGFNDNPQGRCLRLCFHVGTKLPADAGTPEFAEYLKMDCAEGEECVLAKIDIGFERQPRALIGMCLPAPKDVPRERYVP